MPRPAPLWDLLGFGAVTVDDLICVDRYPPPDAKEPIVSRQQVGGGPVGTALTAVEVALLAAPIARAHGIPIVADFERSTSPRLAELLPQVDHLILNRIMGQQLTGAADPSEMVRSLAEPSPICCAVTAGEDGLWYAERGGPPCHLPAFAVAAVDTTGCGDVLHGAYASAIARGSGVHQALMLGAAAAALKTLAPGGRAGIPDLSTVLRFLADCGLPLAHGKPAILNGWLNP
jgi:sugar/nucleoside kinase (ribokinase family)